MPLPRPNIETTIEVPNGPDTVTVRCFSRSEASDPRLYEVGQRADGGDIGPVGVLFDKPGPLDDLSTVAWIEVFTLAVGLDVGTDDDGLATMREWWESAPAVFVDTLIKAIGRISGFTTADGKEYQRDDDQGSAVV